jgi:hypothetical protein
MNILYDITTGRIVQFDNSNVPPPKSVGTDVLTIDGELSEYGFDTHTVDLKSKTLVVMSLTDQAAAKLPNEFDVKQAIWSDLSNTDSYMLPDRDDITPLLRAAWVTYRKALRNLSKYPAGGTPPTPSAMVAAWPVRPNGVDAISELRKRI